MELLIFFVSLFGFLAFGIPIAIVLILCTLVLMLFMGMWDPLILGQTMLQGTNNFSLMAIPFFMFAGEIMSRGGLSERIVKFADLIVGRIKGGLGYAAILSCMLFAGLMGSAVASAAAIGSILIPIMKKAGYKEERATGLICASSVMGPIIPPSTSMIVLGATVQGLSIAKLFMIGLVPGIALGLVLMLAWAYVVKKDGYSDIHKYSKDEAVKIIKDSLPALILPIILLGGIRFGIFTPTEGGTFAVVYAMLICFFWYKELNLKIFMEVCVNAIKTTAIVMFIVAAATSVGWYITVAQIPDQVALLFTSFSHSPLALMLVINIFVFFMSMVMDITPNTLIFAPVFFPVIIKAGIDPYFFSLIFIFNMCIGLITPPVGTVLYVGCSIGKVQFGKLLSGIIPFLIVELITLFIFLFFPSISLGPLKVLMGS